MKIYINGQEFGSNLPLQGGTSDFSNATLKVINNTSNEEITTLATQYTIQNKTNFGGVLNNSWDRQAILNAGTIGLKLNSKVLAREINAEEFVNQIDTSLQLCVVYIPGYLELIPDTSFVANLYDPLTITTSGDFKIHTDHNWTITKSPAFMSISTTSGESGTKSVYFSTTGSSNQDLLTVTAGNQTISVSILYDPTASTVTVDNATVSVEPNAESAQFTGTVQRPTLQNGSINDRVTISYNGDKPEWIGSLTGFNTSEVINGVVHYTFTFPLTANTGNTRSFIFTPVYDTFGQNAQGAECILQQLGNASTITLDKTAIEVDYNSHTETINVTYTGSGTLTVSSTLDWCTASLSGNVITLSILKNNTKTNRSGVISVTDGTDTSSCSILQYGEPTGNITVNKPTEFTIPAAGGSIELDWVATGYSGGKTIRTNVTPISSDWISYSAAQLSSTDLNYSLNPTGTLTFAENTGEERSGTISLWISANYSLITSESLVFTQLGNVTLTIDPTSKSVDNQSGSFNLDIQYTGSETLQKSSDSEWLTISGNTVSYTANTGAQRVGIITISDSKLTATCTVTQSAVSANITVSPDVLNVESASGTSTVKVTYSGSTSPTFNSDSEWLTVRNTTSGDYEVSYTENTSTSRRTGIVTFSISGASAQLTVNQSGTAPTLYLSPQDLQTDYQAKISNFDIVYTGSGNLTVSTTETWFAVAIAAGKVVANIQENTGAERTGNFTVTDGNLSTTGTIKQTVKPSDTITLSPNDITLNYQAQSKTIQITYTGIKNLIARSDSSWLSVGPISNNRFSYSVTQNNGTSRVGKITVSDGSVSSIATVTQSSQDKGSIRISSPSQSIPASGGTITNTVVISGSVGVISVNSSASWCRVSFSSPTITAVCAANPGSTRTATITVSATNADSVRYTITQSAAAQNYIYFENESKSIGYQGGTIVNNLYTNGTTPTYTSTQSWARVSSSGVVTVSSNSSSTSRSATITAANSVGRATYTIYQTGYSTDRPIWKNTIYSETTSSDYVEYHIDSTSGTVLYAGKVYKYPNSTSVEFNVNDIISNYLENMPFPSRDGNTSYNTWKQSFNLVTSTGRSTSYTFYNDWSYEDSLQQINPVSLIVDPNQLFVCSGTNTYFMIGNQQYTVNGTYRLDLSNLTIPCGTEIKVYNNSSLIWTYTVDDLHKDFVIYWANKYGGWDFLPIKGNSVRTDNIESNKYSRIDNYTLYDTKYLNVIKPSWKLYSGWLKGNLADLMGSVDVRLYDLKTKELYKVNITDTQTDYRTYKNSGNRLVSYEINCEMSNNYLRK